jgi:serine/threonine protein kinase
MTPERYRLVGRLYHAALELEPGEQAAFLDEACAGDSALRRKIVSLLAAAARAPGFLDTPAIAMAAAVLADEQRATLAGRRLGHYDVRSLLGSGGMGEVYLARDTRLGRDVALKLLPAAFTRDAERLRRFEREARAASALSHPNITTVFEVGEADGEHYIAIEYVDGPTLRERLSAGPLPLGEALDVGAQVADALAAAHEAGIVHRDVKPENVMLRRDGYVKVLDFGLAKLIERPHDRATGDASIPADMHTAPGVRMGTVRYMSPEQLRGEDVDGRADVFGLGVVLYEMVSGRSPFEGASEAEVIAEILRAEPPPLGRVADGVPTEVERITAKALAKNREDRYPTAGGLAADLRAARLEVEIAARMQRVPTTQEAEVAGPSPRAETLTVTRPTPVSNSTALRELLEPVGGAVPLESSFYIERPTDEKFRSALTRRDSIVLVKGARQVGKTSLLARGLQKAREAGTKVVLVDFQNLGPEDLASFGSLLLSFANAFADQLDLDVSPAAVWKADRSAGANLELFLRYEVLAKVPSSVAWGLDEVDRLFTCGFGSEVFGLFRSWHNKRALDPEGPWRHLTLAIAYATEAHLFITNLNQSPFNVGTRLQLDDFTPEQTAELDRRYDSPLGGADGVERLYGLTGGHPYLTHRALYEMVSNGLDLPALDAQADHDEGPFGDHLRRILVSLTQDAALSGVMRDILRGVPCSSAESFYRLRSAGLVVGDSAGDARPRCRLYATYLAQHLP